MVTLMLAAALLQDPDPVKDLERELDRIAAACAAFEEKFTLGAAGECLRQAVDAAAAADRLGDAKAPAVLYAMTLDRISKAVTALESRSSDLRRVQNQLERGRKRAAGLEESRRAAALRYALDRASIIVSSAAGEAAELVNLGIRCGRDGAWEEAEDALAEAESRLPSLRGSTWEATAEGPRLASVLLARAHAAQGRIKEGADALRRGIERLPDWLDRDHAFSEALHARPEDHARFVKSIRTRGEDADALLLLGHELYFSEHRPTSKEIFERVIRMRPGDPAAKKFLEKLAD